MKSEELREKYKGRINFLFQTTWITCTLIGLSAALFHLPWRFSVPLTIGALIFALQMWGQWDEPGSDW